MHALKLPCCRAIGALDPLTPQIMPSLLCFYSVCLLGLGRAAGHKRDCKTIFAFRMIQEQQQAGLRVQVGPSIVMVSADTVEHDRLIPSSCAGQLWTGLT